MIKIAIIGGKLQGLEAAYLSGKADMEITLIDRNQQVPARNLCTHFVCEDITNKSPILIEELKKVDFILPALENEEALLALAELSLVHGLKLAFDLAAYRISSSKILSDQLIHEHHIPAPGYYPNCEAPFIVKPSGESGSTGVSYYETAEELEAFLKAALPGEEWVAQEFLAGKSYSIEVIGRPGNYRTYEITELFMDDIFDCMRVTAPCDISDALSESFSEIALRLAEILGLKGIMDVEVIHNKGELKVLEIDARLPSQTPTAVYHASGINMVSELADLFCTGDFSPRGGLFSSADMPLEGGFVASAAKPRSFVSYEHLKISEGVVSAHGEHIISKAGPLKLYRNFFGADEAITNYSPGDKSFLGTFINTAKTQEELENKRADMANQLKRIGND